MQEQSTILSRQYFCGRKKTAKLLCISKNCENNAFCCFNDDCELCQNHKKCKMIKIQYFLQRIISKKHCLTEDIRKGIIFMQKSYDQAIERLSRDKQFITNQISRLGYNQLEIQLLDLLENDLHQQITGKLNAKILQIKKQKQWVASEQIIKKYWKDIQKTLNQKFNLFKMCPTIGIPKLQSKVTDQIEIILDFFPIGVYIEKINLLFRASQWNFQASKFHSMCDGIQNTLVLARTQFGRVIGGFTKIPWCTDQTYGRDYEKKSFLFSVTNRQKYQCLQPRSSNYGNHGDGPIFGAGHDFYICNQSNTENDSYFSFPTSYNNGKYENGQQSYTAFCGSPDSFNAHIIEWEVFQIQFL